MSQAQQNPDSSSNAELGTVDLLQQIKSGLLNPKQLKPAVRQQVVAVLMDDGYSTSDIAKILRTTDRTIERDRRALRENTVLNKDPALVPQMAGRILQEAESSMQRMRRATRGKEVSAAVKVDAEHRCYQIQSDLVQRLQSLGYLPTAKQQVEAEVVHHAGHIADYQELELESARLLEVAGKGDGDDDVARREQIQQIADESRRAKMQEELVVLESEIQAEQPAPDNDANGESNE